MRTDAMRRIQEQKLVAIIRGVGPANILETARALLAGGVSVMEVALNHSAAEGIRETLRSIALLREQLGGQITLGAGTVLTPRQVADACGSGAEFVVSPNVDPQVIAKSRECGMLSMPGALTPTEMAAAHQAGGDIVKLFPAGLWGVSYIRAVRSPLPHIPVAAVGGVDLENAVSLLAAGACCLGVGGSLVDAKAAAAGDFPAITNAARRFTERIHGG